MARLPLKHPLTFGKKTIDSLTFRDHTTAGDYLAFDQRGGVAQRIALIASLTGTDDDDGALNAGEGGVGRQHGESLQRWGNAAVAGQ